jgi:hypothetical protein
MTLLLDRQISGRKNLYKWPNCSRESKSKITIKKNNGLNGVKETNAVKKKENMRMQIKIQCSVGMLNSGWCERPATDSMTMTIECDGGRFKIVGLARYQVGGEINTEN